jgi:hypothetical protein
MLDGETMQHEFESEYEGEEFLSNLLKGAGSALGLFEGEREYEDEYENEAFFKKIRGLANIAPVLKKVAPLAARAVGTAIGGPAARAALGGIAGQLARESEYE